MQVITKVWGREVVRVNNDRYCFKELHVSAGKRCSLHIHGRKDETFVVASGECILQVGDVLSHKRIGDTVRIKPRTVHRFGSRDGCVLHEVSTHHEDADVVRLDPSGEMPAGWGDEPSGIGAEEAASLRTIRRQTPGRIVLASGCFDLLHAGHVSLLSRARELGDVLVVAINSDSSIRRLKGSGRPKVPARERETLLRSLRCVDHVVEFDAPTPECVSDALRPDLVVKGADWNGKPVPEAQGATLVVLPETVARRTSDLAGG